MTGGAAVRRCDFSGRSFEQEFVAGTAQIFRSEIAAVSSNFLMLLVLSGCDPACGSDENPVNPLAKGRIPVAILGSEEVDVGDVDRASLRFGPAGARPA